MSRAARLATTLYVLSAIAAGCNGTPTDSDAGNGPGTDGAASDTHQDANADTGGSCHADADCSDGLFCNGDERCASGTCAAGTAPSCSDAIDCTRDFCSEDRRACVHQVADADGDGHGIATCVDGGGVALGDDCDDTDANTFPGNREVCDTMRHDEDCVTTTHGAIDHDSDGFEDAACCNGTSCGTDCDDSNRSVNPTAIEACDHVDNNCDTHVDEMLGLMMYPDTDRDGYGDSAGTMVTQCGDTVGFAVRGGDCDDMRVDRNPGQLEVCDTIDNDCDMTVDENTGNVPWYVDADHDGYGDPHGATLVQCAPPTGSYSLVGTDCDDTTNARSPRAPEVCNAADDDCNGLADFQINRSDFEDDDHDGVPDLNCGGALGHDCNDRDATALPGAAEICNGRDDDCDTTVDEDATSATFHRDADMDGYGDPGTAVIACSPPTGYVTDAADCDDAAAGRHPGAAETCNASDDDCDRRIDETPAQSTCTIPGAVAACTVGICHAAGCQPGFSDCTIADGCETSTMADDSHCGACSTTCDPMYAACARSTCVPSGYDGIAGVSPGDDVGSAIAVDSAHIAIGGTFSGAGFGVGCGTHFDAQDKAAIVSLRSPSGSCLAAIAIDGTGAESVTSIALGPAGSVYVALTTTSTTLSVGGMAANAGTGQGARDAVVACLDSTLHAVWVQRFGGTFDDGIGDLALDQAELWAVGAMRGPAMLGTQSLAASSSTDPIVIQLDAATGAPMQLLSATSAGDDGAVALALDSSDVYVVGSAIGATTFGTVTRTAAGASDAFLWVLQRDGVTVDARLFGGTSPDMATSVALAGAYVAVGGVFQGSAMFDATMLTSAGMSDGFVTAVSASSLAVSWTRQVGGSGPDSVNDLAFSGMAGAIAAVGTFTGMASLGGSTVMSAGGSDAFVLTMTPTTGTILRSPDTLGGAGPDHGIAIAVSSFFAWVAGDYGAAWTTHGEVDFPGIGGLDAMWLTSMLPLT